MNPLFTSIKNCDSSSIAYNELPSRESAILETSDVIIPANVKFPVYLNDDVEMTFQFGKSDLYMDPLNSSFYLQFRVVKDNGDIFPPNADMAVISNFLYTSIQSCQIWSGGRIVKHYHQLPFILQPVMLTELDKNYIDTVLGLTTAFWMENHQSMINRL